MIGFFVAVWLGRRAEQILGVEDPGSVVIDEITALPLAFIGPVILFSHNRAIGEGGNPAEEGTPGGGSGGAIYNDG